MAKSKYEYVKLFEKDDSLLPNTWIVIRIDGRCFHGFSRAHSFAKPNDINALNLMNIAAKSVMRELSTDIVIAYGDSDEYSFLLTRDCKLYNRREFKLVSAFVSLFTSYYMYHWKDCFPETILKYPPSFDGRAVLYPDIKNVRDYFSWRQADCHINNLHNTTFWALVHSGMAEDDATNRLSGTLSADKNEILWSEFGTNYNREPPIFRKGTVIYRELETIGKPEVDTTGDKTAESPISESDKQTASIDSKISNDFIPVDVKSRKGRGKRKGRKFVLKEEHTDIIKDEFWESKPWILV